MGEQGFYDGQHEAAMAQAEHQCQTAAPDPDHGWEWAVVEVMGHRRHAGRTREVERFGVKMVRVDVPKKGDPDAHGWTTHFYPGSALFSFTPAEREAVLAANRPYEPPARLALERRVADDLDHEDDDDRPF